MPKSIVAEYFNPQLDVSLVDVSAAQGVLDVLTDYPRAAARVTQAIRNANGIESSLSSLLVVLRRDSLSERLYLYDTIA